MKNSKSLGALALLAALAAAPVSCRDLLSGGEDETGAICVHFTATKGGLSQIPDTGEFTLVVLASDGSTIYSGLYSQSPETIIVSAGNYTVSALSCRFSEPVFDCPQWGATQIVSVAAGQTASVYLECTQLNCGIRLLPDATFRTAFPRGTIYLKSAEGSLMYSYNESRTAYFKAGTVGVLLENEGTTQTLCSRTMEAAEMLTLGLSASEGNTTSGITVAVDTTRSWTSDNFHVGDDQSGPAEAWDVTEARSHIGETDVWVQGYIVGVATGTGKFQFSGTFSKNTNIILGLRSNSTDKDYLLSVELPKGNARDALNLQDNPDLLGKKVAVKGDLVSAYYGIPGLKSADDWSLD